MAARLFSWLGAWLGIIRDVKLEGQKAIANSMKADIAVASTVIEAEAFYGAEQYCQELESNGQEALAAEIRRRLSAIPSFASVPACGGQAEKPDEQKLEHRAPAPMQLPSPAPMALPAPESQKRKPGRPRKNPVELPAPLELPKPSQTNPSEPRY